jgi:predicted SAM-dependent methyltransferase
MKLGRLSRLLAPVRKRPIPSAAEAARTAALFEDLGDPGFLSLAYQIILQRPVDSEGYRHFSTEMQRKEIDRIGVVISLFDSDEFRQRCLSLSHILHRSRIEIVRQLPPAEIIVDMGGTCISDERGALVVMGYPYKFQSLTVVDLPADARCEEFADGGKEHARTVQTNGGPVHYLYQSMTDVSGVGDASVDLVYSGQSIEHVTQDDAARVCREAWRILKPGGYFCLDTPNRTATRLQFPNRYINADHRYEYTPAELAELVTRNGFSIEEAKGMVLIEESIRRGGFLEEEFRKHEGVYHNYEKCYLIYYRCRKAA